MFDSLNDFYLLCTAGCEEILLKEIEMRFPNFNFKLKKQTIGGLEIETQDFQTALSLNIHLKTMNALYLRVFDFKARDLPKLYKKTKNFPWREFFQLEQIDYLQLKVTSKESRLIHTKKIEASFKKAFQDSFKASPPKKSFVPYFLPNLILSFFQDECRVSINTSEDLLHKRRLSSIINQAPLRETIAASLLLKMLERSPHCKNLIDPMCGSATILLEALNFNKRTNRHFLFENHPNFKEVRAKEVDLGLKDFYGSDINNDLISILQKNHPELNLKARDFFNLQSPDKSSLLFFNPPYGKRLKVEKDFLKKIVLKLNELAPQKAFFLSLEKNILQTKSVLEFKHGGLKVYLLEFNPS